MIRGDVAQLGERCPCKAEVGGSTPLISTTLDCGKGLKCDLKRCSLKSEYLTGSNLILFVSIRLHKLSSYKGYMVDV